MPTDSTKPGAIQITDYRFIYFTYLFKGAETPLTFVVRLSHTLSNTDAAFIRMHNHQVGDEVTGIPTRGKNGLCISNVTVGGVQHITSTYVEAALQLKVPTCNHSPKDVLRANGNFIREQLELHFESIRRALAARWTFVAFDVLEPDSTDWRTLPLIYSPAKPK